MMKHLGALFRVFVQAAALVAMASCGGGGGGGADAGGGGGSAHPPAISNLSYSPSSASASPNGTMAITGSMDVSDAGGDISAVRMTTSAGADLSIPMALPPGTTSGTGTAQFIVSVDQPGKYTFEVWALDRAGDSSNRLTGTFEVVPAASSAPWVQLSVSPPHPLFGIAANAHQYVAVGAGGTVMTSPDAVGWQVLNAGVTHTLRSIAWSGNRFVAVGNNADDEAVVVGSPDGATWSVVYRSQPRTAQLAKVIWSGTQFIAVGQEHMTSGKLYGLVLTSPDGVTWIQRASQSIELGEAGFPLEKSMTSLAWSGSIAAITGLAPSADPAVWVSTNLDAWTPGTLPTSAVALFSLSDVAWGNSRFVAVSPVTGWGSGAPTFVSTDGVNWQGSPAEANLPPMNAVAAGSNEFVAVGSSFRMSSPDGLAWSVSPMTGCGNAVLWDGARYVSVGESICRSQ